MIDLRRASFFAATFFVLISGFPARAWDVTGHEVVATMAYDRLNPKARAAVDALAREMVGPVGTYDAITLSSWMDDLKKNPTMPYHGEFLSWHYIDIPIDPRDPMPSFEPGQDNEVHGDIVQALKRAVVVLKGGTDPYIKSKAMACAMIMHLVGDIHQPLHCATKYFFTHGELHQDSGGNKEDVLNGPIGEPKFNLHAFWDSAYRASFDPVSGDVVLDAGFDIRKTADGLKSGRLPTPAELVPDFEAWAQQSNAIARDFVYRDITATDNRKFCRLSSGYVEKSHQIARDQLRLAAFRLAELLNQTIGADQPGPIPASYPAGPSPN